MGFMGILAIRANFGFIFGLFGDNSGWIGGLVVLTGKITNTALILHRNVKSCKKKKIREF